MDPDEDHECDEENAAGGRSPFAEARDQQQDAGTRFGDPQTQSGGEAERFRNLSLGQPDGGSGRVGQLPKSGEEKDSGDQNGRDPVERCAPDVPCPGPCKLLRGHSRNVRHIGTV